MGKFKQIIKREERKRNKKRFYEKTKNLSDNELAASFAKSNKSVLCSLEWKTLRNSVIDFYGCKCMKCKKVLEQRKFANVDHIKPRKYFPELTWEFSNLQVLCSKCNREKGNKNQNDYRDKFITSRGEELDLEKDSSLFYILL
ncbi:MAG: HNH endonuclease [Waterburya sp.]